jgi:hypothetical protein
MMDPLGPYEYLQNGVFLWSSLYYSNYQNWKSTYLTFTLAFGVCWRPKYINHVDVQGQINSYFNGYPQCDIIGNENTFGSCLIHA